MSRAAAKRIADAIKISWSPDDIKDDLSGLAAGATTAALDGYGLSISTGIFRRANAAARDWAAEHAGELITLISDSTRQFIANDIATALDEGWSTAQLKQQLTENYAFSPDRGLAIARSEVTNAYGQANLIAARESGLDGKKSWMASAGACEDCQGNEDDGEIGLDETFSSGDLTPGAHPSCRCSLQFVPATRGEESDIEEEPGSTEAV